MKILGISGGMRNGSNDGMCIEALMGAKEMGAEVEFIQLQNLHIRALHRLHRLRAERAGRPRRQVRAEGRL